MQKRGFTTVEIAILGLVLLILIIGFTLFQVNAGLFERYVQEDGIVEWLTVLGLLLGVIVCVKRFLALRRFKSWWFLFVVFVLGLLLFFAAGEEISWGQRILGIQSSEFFKERNAQGETNLHNLVVDGVKLNKLIFSIGLVIVLGLYLLAVPFLYQRNLKFKSFIDRSGIPVPRSYQVISILALFGLTELIRHGKRAELLEAGITLLFFLIIQYPKNAFIFSSGKNPGPQAS
jgi:cell division protein FtsW (lipid II flippase)